MTTSEAFPELITCDAIRIPGGGGGAPGERVAVSLTTVINSIKMNPPEDKQKSIKLTSWQCESTVFCEVSYKVTQVSLLFNIKVTPLALAAPIRRLTGPWMLSLNRVP